MMVLRECKTRSEVNEFFIERGISDTNFEAKNAFLLEVMHNPRVFFSTGKPTDEQKYELILQAFLSGNWKYSEAISKLQDSYGIVNSSAVPKYPKCI